MVDRPVDRRSTLDWHCGLGHFYRRFCAVHVDWTMDQSPTVHAVHTYVIGGPWTGLD